MQVDYFTAGGWLKKSIRFGALGPRHTWRTFRFAASTRCGEVPSYATSAASTSPGWAPMVFLSSAPSNIARSAPSRRRHQVRCIAEQQPTPRSHLCSTGSAIGRSTGSVSPPVMSAVYRSPAVEFFDDALHIAGDVDAVNQPLSVQLHVRMQRAAIGPRCARMLSWAPPEERATANCFRAGLVTVVAVEQVRLDE